MAALCSCEPEADENRLAYGGVHVSVEEEPAVIAKILAHLERTAPEQHQAELPLRAGAPPVQSHLL